MSFVRFSVAVGILAALTIAAKTRDPLASLLIKHQEALVHLLEDYDLLLNSTEKTCSIEDQVQLLANTIETDVRQKLNEVLRKLGDLEDHELPINSTEKKYSKIEEQIENLGKKIETEVVQKLNDVLHRVDNLEGSWNHTRDLIFINSSNIAICKEGWLQFQGSCYYFAPAKVSWEDGREGCKSMDSDYVKVESADEFHFLQGHVTMNSWIGLNDKEIDGKYTWISDGEEAKIPKSWWHKNEPNNDHDGTEDCIDIWVHHGHALLNDDQCYQTYNYICEKKPEALHI